MTLGVVLLQVRLGCELRLQGYVLVLQWLHETLGRVLDFRLALLRLVLDGRDLSLTVILRALGLLA